MRFFFFACLTISCGIFMGLFSTPSEQGASSERLISISEFLGISRPKRVVGDDGRLNDFVQSAKRLQPYTVVPAKVLVAIADQETGLGENYGRSGSGLSRSRSLSEQVLLDILARKYKGVGLDNLETSSAAAFGLVQARPALFLHHTGMRVDFGSTPTVLLHGTDRYRSMSRSERVAGIKIIQHKLGLRGIDVDGAIGPKTLDAIDRSVQSSLLRKSCQISFGKKILFRADYSEDQ